ncbi:Receptor-type tyrosine-protein phosphatase mu [Acipenser ruthenus]|uniref:Receptor-type tyrosine-protein phosphatase mu n=1 Tax=Acipenser ruthenus TaxID=7906 RepID=A0A444UPE0_ACIRT|nr:Receptor-type tyrosine-protein phosphatase mu [Acipenser ruthenus]
METQGIIKFLPTILIQLFQVLTKVSKEQHEITVNSTRKSNEHMDAGDCSFDESYTTCGYSQAKDDDLDWEQVNTKVKPSSDPWMPSGESASNQHIITKRIKALCVILSCRFFCFGLSVKRWEAESWAAEIGVDRLEPGGRATLSHGFPEVSP